MKFRAVVLFLVIITAFCQTAVSSENPMLVRIELSGETDIERLTGLHFDIPYVSDTFAEIVIFPGEIGKLNEAGFSFEIIHEDIVSFYQDRNPLNLDMGGYPTFAEAIDIMDSLHNRFPMIVSSKWSIGTTWDDNNLWVFKISDYVNSDDDEPEVFYNSLTHAREPIGMTWLLHFAGWLCENYGFDPVATEIVDNRELFFLPVFNPDGYEYNRQTSPNGGGMWRKNRRDNGDGTYGVDLNRNWGYMWGYDNIGSSPDTYSETYRGVWAFSEPETQAVRDFIISRSFSFIVNSHAYGEYLLYPWGYDDIYTPDHDFFTSIGDSASTLTGYQRGTAWELLYNTNGDANDWDYGEQIDKPLIFCMLPETGSSFDGFWPQESRIPELNEQMLPLGIYIAQLAGSLAGLEFEYPEGIPETLTPGLSTSFDVNINGIRGGLPISGSGQLHYSINGGEFYDVFMDEYEANNYQAVLPAIDCGSIIEFYITATEFSAGVISDPPDAPASTFRAVPITDITEVFSDDFETDLGWTVIDSGGLVDGTWNRGVPAGGGDRGDPPTDYDGSGYCYLTDNVYGNSDVDDGYTFLISPAFNLEGVEATISYALWYTNIFGDNPNNDLFKVYVSNDNGANWVLAETIGPVTQPGWTEHSISVNDFVAPSNQTKVRFEASDLGGGSVVEAGIDAFSIEAIECDTAQDIPTLSEWGMLLMALLLLAVGTVAVACRRKAALCSAA
ncbi:MAG: IPTL-CTERM sorting domain-containing protein [candidate division Zixibacteria bacterium]